VSLGDERRERKTSCFTGVSWNTNRSVWHAYLRNPQTKRRQYIGSYDSETSAAMAYDCAAVEMHGPIATSRARSSPSRLSHGETSGGGSVR
jgi:hypothetical protein